MPNKYKPLTNEEKAEARKRYSEYVDKINAYFASVGKPSLDKGQGLKDLEASFNDETKVAKYRIANEAQEREEKQTQLIKQLGEKYKGIAVHDEKNYLARGIKFMLKTDGSKESEKYNDDLVKAYYKNPEDFTHNYFKTLINYDPKELFEIGNDEVKQLEFARDNPALCKFSNEFINISRMQGLNVPKDVSHSLECITGLLEHVAQTGRNPTQYKDLDFFAFPKLTNEQMFEVMRNSRTIFGKGLTAGQKQALTPNRGGTKSFIEYVRPLQDLGFDFAKENPFTKYKAVETDPDTHEEKEVSLNDLIDKKPNVTLKPRSYEEIENINDNITGQFKLKYNFEFQKRLGKNIGKPYNVFNAEKEMKGNLWDRWFHRPSNGFKGFMNALKDYSNPKSSGHLDKTELLRRAKFVNYDINGNRLVPTSEIERRRMEFVDNTIKTLTEMEQEDAKIREEINKDIASKSVEDPSAIKKEPAFDNDKELEEVFGEENLNSNDLDKSFILLKDDESEISDDDPIVGA